MIIHLGTETIRVVFQSGKQIEIDGDTEQVTDHLTLSSVKDYCRCIKECNCHTCECFCSEMEMCASTICQHDIAVMP